MIKIFRTLVRRNLFVECLLILYTDTVADTYQCFAELLSVKPYMPRHSVEEPLSNSTFTKKRG